MSRGNCVTYFNNVIIKVFSFSFCLDAKGSIAYRLVLIAEVQCIVGSHKLFLSPFALMQKEEKIKSKTDALSLLFTIVIY